MDQKYYVKELLNGMKVLLIHIPNCKLVRIEMNLKCGYLYEKSKNREISHFLEHFQSKFTSSKYPDAKNNLEELKFRAIDKNGSTQFHLNSYSLEGESIHLDFMLDLMLNSIYNFQIDEQIYEQEKNAIKNELLERDSSKISNFIKNTIYKVVGLKNMEIDYRIKNLDNITIDKILEHHRKFYSTRNIYFCVCGDFNIKQTYNTIKQKSENYIKLDYDCPKLRYRSYNFKKSVIYFYKNNYNDFDLYLRFYTDISPSHRDINYILCIVNIIYNRLFKLLRYDYGYIYDIIFDFFSYYNGISVIEFKMKIENHKNFMICLSSFLSEIKNLKKKKITDYELDKIKSEYRQNVFQENLEQRLHKYTHMYCEDLMQNNYILSHKYKFERFLSTNSTMLMNVCKKVLRKKKMQIVYTGNTNYNHEIKKLLPDAIYLEKN